MPIKSVNNKLIGPILEVGTNQVVVAGCQTITNPTSRGLSLIRDEYKQSSQWHQITSWGTVGFQPLAYVGMAITWPAASVEVGHAHFSLPPVTIVLLFKWMRFNLSWYYYKCKGEIMTINLMCDFHIFIYVRTRRRVVYIGQPSWFGKFLVTCDFRPLGVNCTYGLLSKQKITTEFKL